MKLSGYLCVTTFLIIGIHLNGYSQIPNRQFDEDSFDSTQYSQYQNQKKIPDEITPQVLIAMSFYPELSDTKIIFRYRKRKTPLASRPRIRSTFRKKENRTYVITISTKSNTKLTPILFSNLPFNAQIGVLGHELGHITGYKNKNTWQLLGLYLRLLNAEHVNEFEFNTDHTTIAHGLGYQLYDWSQYVRQALDIPEWRGASDANYNKKTNMDQRYMNPLTVQSHIRSNDIYGNIR